MGFALVRAALKDGHRVTVIAAPAALRPPVGAGIVEVETAEEMFEAVKRHFPRCDCLIMAAAVSDYTPVRPAKSKIKRSGKALTIKLKPTADILKWAGGHKKRNQIVVGFALEDRDLRANAERKLREKNLDMIVVNRPAAIGAAKSTIEIRGRDFGWLRVKNASKVTIARRIISRVEGLAE
jgi:phosphopantothenoylcysteine decarboxylase/phosphopantothenate--cysteine ligase